MTWFSIAAAIVVAKLFDRIVGVRIGGIIDTLIDDKDDQRGYELVGRVKAFFMHFSRFRRGRSHAK